jgi:hypothetical protein
MSKFVKKYLWGRRRVLAQVSVYTWPPTGHVRNAFELLHVSANAVANDILLGLDSVSSTSHFPYFFTNATTCSLTSLGCDALRKCFPPCTISSFASGEPVNRPISSFALAMVYTTSSVPFNTRQPQTRPVTIERNTHMQPQHRAPHIRRPRMQPIPIPEINRRHTNAPPALVARIIFLDLADPVVSNVLGYILAEADVDQEIRVTLAGHEIRRRRSRTELVSDGCAE